MVKSDEEKLQELCEAYVLRMFHVGSEPTNYSILTLVPSTTEKMMKKSGLSKMPFYRRMKQLKRAGLIDYNNRDRKGKVEKTELTDRFFYAKERMDKEIAKDPLKYFQLRLGK
jgi:hypothetical protein